MRGVRAERRRRRLAAGVAALALAACGRTVDGAASLPCVTPARPPEAQAVARPPDADPAAVAPHIPAAEILAWRLGRVGAKTPGVPRVVFLGDSVTFGFGLTRGERPFPELTAQRLADEGLPIEVVNAGLVGETTFTGRQRLAAIVALQPDVVVVELGGNDFLLGLPLQGMADNLRVLLREARAAGARVLLAGIRLPDAVGGTRRARDFQAIYADVANELDVPLLPDLFEDALLQPRFMLADNIHPTAEGHRVLAFNLLPHLRAVLQALPVTR